MPDPSRRALKGATVICDDGIRCKVAEELVATDQAARVALEFDDGARVLVSAELLTAQPDATYRVPLRGRDFAGHSRAASNITEQIVVPVVAEELDVETSRVARGAVRVRTRVETRDEVVDAPLMHEDVVVEHIAANTIIEGDAPEVREEDGILEIPLIEEVLVIEKRLILRETVRISRRRTVTRTPQTVTLRREVAEIERVGPGDAPATKNDHNR